MRKYILLALGSVLISSLFILNRKEEEVATKYKLVFSDEFNSRNGSQPDTSKWVHSKRGPSTWNRWISNSKDVVYIKNGSLVCRAIPNHDLHADTAQMLTGAIETYGKFDFQYGKVEVRMKTNTMPGNFPAVWMKPVENKIDDVYKYGEIDIIEVIGNDGKSSHAVHTHQSHMLKKASPYIIKTSTNVRKWHVYGMEWTKDYIVWTVDGREVGRFKKSEDKDDIADDQWTFDRAFYLRLNQSVGNGSEKRTTPITNKIYETHFDWIRVYQAEE